MLGLPPPDDGARQSGQANKAQLGLVMSCFNWSGSRSGRRVSVWPSQPGIAGPTFMPAVEQLRGNIMQESPIQPAGNDRKYQLVLQLWRVGTIKRYIPELDHCSIKKFAWETRLKLIMWPGLPVTGYPLRVTAPAMAELSPFRPTFHRRDTQRGTVRGGAEFPRVSH